jgi:hypothetical protein
MTSEIQKAGRKPGNQARDPKGIRDSHAGAASSIGHTAGQSRNSDGRRVRCRDGRRGGAACPGSDAGCDRPFVLGVLRRYGGADLYFTEYFRVYAGSHLDRSILRSIVDNPTGRPVVAQLIGNDIPELVRTARELQRYPVAAIDLNLGCPAPVVYRKCAGGGLLREPDRVDAILRALRQASGSGSRSRPGSGSRPRPSSRGCWRSSRVIRWIC